MKILKSLTSRMSFMFGAGVIALAMVFTFMPATSQAAALYRELQLGMSGADVSSLQVFLAKDVTIYPQGIVSGYFGLLTKAAVMNFQVRNGISAVGRVGPITMAAINAQMNGDVSAPRIHSVNVGPTNNAASINWSTTELASASVYYSASPIKMLEGSASEGVTIFADKFVANTDFTSSHSAFVTGLQSNTTYYYVLYVRDGFGNETITLPNTFKTLQ